MNRKSTLFFGEVKLFNKNLLLNVQTLWLTVQKASFCAGRIFFLLLQKNIFMTFDIVIIGYIAGFCTAIAQFPQALKVIKTGDTESISFGMYSIMTMGIFFWFVYGVLLSNLPMMLANGVCLIPSIYILFITVRNILKTKKISA